MTPSGQSSFLVKPKNKIYGLLFRIYQWLEILSNPVWWVLDPRVETVLDVGCGQGYPMQQLKAVCNIKATGVDLFDKYLKEAKKLNIYDQIVKSDVTKLKFPENSFDAVICLQVVEHQTKAKAMEMIKDMEMIAKHQVIIATPLGFFDHPDMDGNILQRHLSGWNDEDFTKMGYKVTHQSLSLFFGNAGLVHKQIPKIIKAAIFVLDHLLTPIYFFFPRTADYWIIAHKELSI